MLNPITLYNGKVEKKERKQEGKKERVLNNFSSKVASSFNKSWLLWVMPLRPLCRCYYYYSYHQNQHHITIRLQTECWTPLKGFFPLNLDNF